MTIPTLNTARLILRPPRETDFPDYEALMASERAVFMGGPFNKKAAWGLFCHGVALWEFYGHGSLMIVLRETGVCIGEVAVNHGPLYPEKELGWMLYDGYEGQGYAYEAAEAFRDWAFATLKLETLTSCIDADNLASIRLAEKLGAVRDDEAPKQDPEDLIYRHPKPV